MYLDGFFEGLESRYKGSLFTVRDAEQINGRAKEYLHRLQKAGKIERVCRGWYRIPDEVKDAWDFLTRDKGFKVIIKQTASSVWNYDFVHRNVYRLAVEDSSYKRALEKFAEKRGWMFEVERYDSLKKFDCQKIDGLFVERPEPCIVSCAISWAFLDSFAVLYFRRDDITLRTVRELGRWKRISKTKVRAWSAIKYGCNLFNERLNERIFDVKQTSLGEDDIRDLVEEAVEKVVEFA